MYNTLIDSEESIIDTSNIVLNVDNDIENQIQSTCIICLDDINEPVQDINLLNSDKYKKRCICNAPVHKSCLIKWYKKSNKCLICHSKILPFNKPLSQRRREENEIRSLRYNNNNYNRKLACNVTTLLILVCVITYIWIIQQKN